MPYLLDTNIISELRKKEAASRSVLSWYRSVADTDLFISVLTIGEIRRGIVLKLRSDSKQSRHLDRWLAGLVQQYKPRILPVTMEIANLWGTLCPQQRLPVVDGFLAATAIHHDLTLVTRNVDDVERSGVKVFDPFELP